MDGALTNEVDTKMDEDKRIEELPVIVSAAPVKRRRKFNPALKREIVEATLNGSESVSEVARRYDVNANQLFKWRKQYREGLMPPAPTVLPVEVASPPRTGELEICMTQGERILVRGPVNAASLRTVLEVLR